MGEFLRYPSYGSDMRLITLLIGLATALAALCLVAWASVNVHYGHLHKDLEEALHTAQNMGRDDLVQEALERNGYWKAMRAVRAINICCAVINAAQCISSACLMIAAYTSASQSRALVLRAWVLFACWWLASNALLVPAMAVMGLVLAAHVAGVVVFLVMVAAMPGAVYCILLVRRHHKELLGSQQQGAEFHDHARLTVNG